ncbi:MAG: putative Ca2+-binding protein [uncultured bacterium]|nr:MAG: putative Ca2+-binding protein [uncultured bacterium]OGJ47559.1 MAG: hypothetical protein A2244_00650 [Candidatus Peregrinibacteria bacterium RIFOXYA2_FULL_41_18]OGJ49640.1 MAG: hypothetical protein A2344_02460 [Candidatus Peregrinibacteria bacterium RIFOXYB12_FULL_41_12]
MKKVIMVLILGIAIAVPIKQIFASDTEDSYDEVEQEDQAEESDDESDSSSYCSEGYKNEVEECSGENCFLYEFYNDEFGVPSLNASDCAGGCEDGTCISETGIMCTDSDDEDYYEQGTTVSNPDTDLASEFSDYCSEGYKNPVDSCSGEHCYLFENICNDDGITEVEAVDCENGCSDGACIEEEEDESSDDSDEDDDTDEQTTSVLLPPAGFEDVVITNLESYENPFSDTDITSLEGQSAAELYRRGIIGGYPDGEFKGDKEVNRAEAAKFLLYAKYETVEDEMNNGSFSDVVDNQWYTKFVMKAAKLGIINGYADGTFGPANTVNTAEFLKMLTLTFELEENLDYSYTDVSAEDWFAPYAGTAVKYDLFPDRSEDTLYPAQNLTRKEVAVAIYQYLANR